MTDCQASQTGFSLLEMTVVLLLITLVASIAVRETSELAFQTRYEQTRDRLELIKQAILGNPRLVINGQQAISGFVADMGRLPVDLRELIQRSGDCDNNAGDVSSAACTTLGGTWDAAAWNSDSVAQTDGTTGLRYGWNGPYLTISSNPAEADAFTDGWGRSSNDDNYGWSVLDWDSNSKTSPSNSTVNLIIQSLGKDQQEDASLPTSNPTSYDYDYPVNIGEYTAQIGSYYPQPAIRQQDWQVDISGGISVNFKKTEGITKLPPVSRCSNPLKDSKSTCEPADIWTGGCPNAGYYNKTSCTGTWKPCSDDISTTKTDCETAGKEWYGEGFGCSDQTKMFKDSCILSGVWRSCTYNETITTESDCLTANEIWYGDNIFNKPSTAPIAKKICLRIFYRTSESQIGSLISDENITNDSILMTFDPKTITVDGGSQTIKFKYFRNSNSVVGDVPITTITMGALAIGVYEYTDNDGDGIFCEPGSDNLYPADRQNPIQVDFRAHTTLPVINW